MFTAKFIENLKPREKAYQKREGNGFGIRVFPSGVKRWIFFYQFKGQRKIYTIGAYPDLKLSDAREEFYKLRRMVAKGKDPLESRNQEKAEPTTQEVIALYKKSVEKRIRSIYEEKRILNKNVPNAWLKMWIKDIDRHKIREHIEQMSESAPQMANATLKLFHSFFAFAVSCGFIEFNPCSNIKKPAPDYSRERYLSDEEIKVFWKNLQLANTCDAIKSALMIALLTGQRVGEIAAMRYEEIDGNWWTIPGNRCKNFKSHRVYLTETVHQIIGAGQGCVFPSPHKQKVNKSITVKSVSAAVAYSTYFGVKEKWTPHDLRRTMASHMTSLGIARFVVARVLNHTDSSVTAVYDRNSYDKEKKAAMFQWEQKFKMLLDESRKVRFLNVSQR